MIDTLTGNSDNTVRYVLVELECILLPIVCPDDVCSVCFVSQPFSSGIGNYTENVKIRNNKVVINDLYWLRSVYLEVVVVVCKV